MLLTRLENFTVTLSPSTSSKVAVVALMKTAAGAIRASSASMRWTFRLGDPVFWVGVMIVCLGLELSAGPEGGDTDPGVNATNGNREPPRRSIFTSTHVAACRTALVTHQVGPPERFHVIDKIHSYVPPHAALFRHQLRDLRSPRTRELPNQLS
jgi:hypothetical protein